MSNRGDHSVAKTPETMSSDKIDSSLSTAMTNVSMSPELFEKLYLNVKTPHVGKEKCYANPSPLGFLGLVICTLTFSMILMGWGGSANPNAVAGMFVFTGPILMLLSAIFLWMQSQFFPMMVCGLFGTFWLSFGLLELPTLGIAASYASPTSTASSPGELVIEGMKSVQYNAAIAIYLIAWGVVVTTFFIFTLRLNIVLVNIFACTSACCFVLSASYWKVASHEYALAQRLQIGGGALIFAVACHGWYMLLVMMCAEMRLTVNLPVGDLSHFWSSSDVELGQLEKRE